MGILYIPPFYEKDFASAIDRFSVLRDEKIEYRLFTLEQRVFTRDWNLLLNMCRTIINEEKDIQMLCTDSHLGQLIIGKLFQEYPRIRSGGGNFLQTFQLIDRSSMKEIFKGDQCVPTLMLQFHGDDWKEIEHFLNQERIDGYVKSVFGFDYQSSSFRFSSAPVFEERIQSYQKLYEDQYFTSLQTLFRIYLPSNQYLLSKQPNYLVQPYFDLVTYPYWRLVIANGCIYEKEIIIWPLVDGYSGW